jgi:hypothetical protein
MRPLTVKAAACGDSGKIRFNIDPITKRAVEKEFPCEAFGCNFDFVKTSRVARIGFDLRTRSMRNDDDDQIVIKLGDDVYHNDDNFSVNVLRMLARIDRYNSGYLLLTPKK